MSRSGIPAVAVNLANYGWCIAAALLCSCSGVPPDSSLPTDSATAATAQEWLLRDCTFGSQGELADAIEKKGDTLYDFFANAYTNGPDSLTLFQWEKGAERNYDAVERLFTSADTQRIPPRVRQRFQATTKQDYVASVVAQCVTSWKSNALLGVGLTRASNALPFINAAFANPKSDSTIRRAAVLAAEIYADTSGLLIR